MGGEIVEGRGVRNKNKGGSWEGWVIWEEVG